MTGILCFLLGMSSRQQGSQTSKETTNDMEKLSDDGVDEVKKKSVFSGVFFCCKKKVPNDNNDNQLLESGDEEKQNDTFTADEISDDMVGLVAAFDENGEDENIASDAAAAEDDDDDASRTNLDESADDGVNTKIVDEEGSSEEDWHPFNESVEIDVGSSGSIMVAASTGVSSNEHTLLSGTFGKTENATDEL